MRRREALRAAALAFGVRPKAIPYAVERGEMMFTLTEDGQLAATGDARHPHDPCVPLDVASWLGELKRAEPFLFSEQRRH